MKTVLLMVAVATLFTGVLTFNRGSRKTAHAKPIAAGYTMDLIVRSDGKLTAKGRRYVKANGDFMEETEHLNPDGSIASRSRFAGTSTHGAVSIDDTTRELKYIGRAALVKGVTAAELKAAKDFHREESLLSFRVIVQRTCDQENRCTEYWVAPELGSDNLKVDLDWGDGHRTTKETVSIVRGEPSFEIPNYPIKRAESVGIKSIPQP